MPEKKERKRTPHLLPPGMPYPDDAVLVIEQVAGWLQLDERTVARLDIERTYSAGDRSPRFLGKDVKRFMEKGRV